MDLDDDPRAFARRFAARMGGKTPSTNQAGAYSQALAYLGVVAATGSDDAKKVVRRMKRTTYHDALFSGMSVRADGRAIHPTSPSNRGTTSWWTRSRPIRPIGPWPKGCPLVGK